jgi:hypothetical protein
VSDFDQWGVSFTSTVVGAEIVSRALHAFFDTARADANLVAQHYPWKLTDGSFTNAAL